MRIHIYLSTILFITTAASAEIVTETIEYKHGSATLEGMLAYDNERPGPLPGVVVVHQWKGIKQHEQDVIRDLAALGYAAFAADIYGKGIRPETVEEAKAQAGKYRADRQLLRARTQAAVDALRGNRRVDRGKIAAIGYCFGGGAVLELARSGSDIRGVVSFHGNLDTPLPAGKPMPAKILVLHGAADPHVPEAQVNAFVKEMESARTDWQMHHFGGAVHAFTDKQAGSNPSGGAAYNERAAARSWEAMKLFLAEIFA